MAGSPSKDASILSDIPVISPAAFASTRFDYLIVGGGTAALVIAARLSAIPTITVGVVEAGPVCFDDPLLTVPGRFGDSIGSRFDWKFETVPQPGLNGRKLQWPRGKVLGGTSALNFMTWTRGNREDYDAWEELGNEGWGWDGMLRFFKKSETLHQSSPEHQAEHQSYFSAEHHGADGPVSTAFSKEYSVPHQHWHATLRNLGLETNKSHFSGSNLGAFTSLTTIDPTTRTRASSATSYYLPNAARANLHVLTDALVKKINLEKNHGDWRATGVSYVCGNQFFTANASAEVILCAGSVQSPQLLEISGIGSAEILERAGISVKVANPNVGEHLQEHMMTAMIYELDPSLTGPDELRSDPTLFQSAQHAYETSRSGPLAMLPCALSYASLPQVIPSQPFNTILTKLPQPRTPRDTVLLRQFIQPRRGQIEYIFDLGNWSPQYISTPGVRYGTLLMMLQLPLSQGSIHISSGHSLTRKPTTHDEPLIDPKYFAGPHGALDFEIMNAAQAFGHRICRTAPLSSIIRRRVFPPEPQSLAEDEDEDFRPWIRASCITDWHPIGTCAMGGREGIAAGVVDARLRVYGVKGLRVADASVMPLHICSHPQATVYAIGEKAASMILEDRGMGDNKPTKIGV
ncbi:putative choline dehydrogenase [Lojkania enalia]|uniref:Choline dehydrogenase n=1 Tax=Lojkania enalia TaxID=147567 RepID=A0A9P4MYH8_9PLEO|nr:putative choline dehydrogenase [Didymosphaeria enalia]